MLALAGCGSLPRHDAEAASAEVPDAWSAGNTSAPAAATPLAQWWQRFDDPLLDRLVGQALQANPSVLAAQAALRQARALRDVAAAALWPTLDASASAQRSRAGGEAGNRFQAGLDAGWELDVFGARRSGVDAATANARASAYGLGDVQVSLAAEVALAYIDLRNAQARLGIAVDNLASQKETLQLTQWRLQAGLLSSLEAEQAVAAAAQTRAQLPALQTAIAQSAHALAVLTGRPPAALDVELAAAGAVPRAADDLALSLPVETLRQRPDVRAAEQGVVAAAAQVSQADAARLPSFRLGGSVGLSALTLGSLTGGGAVVASLLAGVTLPLFDGGAGLANVAAQQAAREQAQAAYRGVVLAALQDVEDALVALRGDRERLGQLQQAAQAAANAARMARQRFGSGLVDFQTVLETQRNQLATQDGVAGAGAAVSADHVRLYKALGGGWQPDGGPDATNDTRARPS
jgi:NodT family efflux transporter outer membrane factor (OMF) lipoprotein